MIISLNVTCSRHDIAENFSFGIKQQSTMCRSLSYMCFLGKSCPNQDEFWVLITKLWCKWCVPNYECNVTALFCSRNVCNSMFVRSSGFQRIYIDLKRYDVYKYSQRIIQALSFCIITTLFSLFVIKILVSDCLKLLNKQFFSNKCIMVRTSYIQPNDDVCKCIRLNTLH